MKPPADSDISDFSIGFTLYVLYPVVWIGLSLSVASGISIQSEQLKSLFVFLLELYFFTFGYLKVYMCNICWANHFAEIYANTAHVNVPSLWATPPVYAQITFVLSIMKE